MKKVFEKRKRTLIPDNAPLTMHKKILLADFIDAQNAYSAFVECNEIDISDKAAVKRFESVVPLPADFEGMCADIKLLNKKQVAALVKWKIKINQKKRKSAKEAAEANEEPVAPTEPVPAENKPDDAYEYLRKADKIERKNKEKAIIKFVKTKMINNDAAGTANVTDNLNDFDFLRHRDIIES